MPPERISRSPWPRKSDVHTSKGSYRQYRIPRVSTLRVCAVVRICFWSFFLSIAAEPPPSVSVRRVSRDASTGCRRTGKHRKQRQRLRPTVSPRQDSSLRKSGSEHPAKVSTWIIRVKWSSPDGKYTSLWDCRIFPCGRPLLNMPHSSLRSDRPVWSKTISPDTIFGIRSKE